LFLPFASIIGVIVSAFSYLKAKKQNKLNPGSFTYNQIKEKRNNVIILSSVSIIIIAFYVFMAIRIHYTLSNAVLSMWGEFYVWENINKNNFRSFNFVYIINSCTLNVYKLCIWTLLYYSVYSKGVVVIC